MWSISSSFISKWVTGDGVGGSKVYSDDLRVAARLKNSCDRQDPEFGFGCSRSAVWRESRDAPAVVWCYTRFEQCGCSYAHYCSVACKFWRCFANTQPQRFLIVSQIGTAVLHFFLLLYVLSLMFSCLRIDWSVHKQSCALQSLNKGADAPIYRRYTKPVLFVAIGDCAESHEGQVHRPDSAIETMKYSTYHRRCGFSDFQSPVTGMTSSELCAHARTSVVVLTRAPNKTLSKPFQE